MPLSAPEYWLEWAKNYFRCQFTYVGELIHKETWSSASFGWAEGLQTINPPIYRLTTAVSDIDQTNINRDIRDGNWLSSGLGREWVGHKNEFCPLRNPLLGSAPLLKGRTLQRVFRIGPLFWDHESAKLLLHFSSIFATRRYFARREKDHFLVKHLLKNCFSLFHTKIGTVVAGKYSK